MIRNLQSQVTRNCLWRDCIREYIVCKVSECEVSRVGCKIYGTEELEERELRKSFAGLSLL